MTGNKIKELRKANKMTQQELAQKLELSPSAIGMYEQDRRMPSIELLIKIGQVFGVSVEYLIMDIREEVYADDISYDQMSERRAWRDQDLSVLLDEFKRKTLNAEGLMFKGSMLSQDDLARIMDAVEVGVEIALKNKGAK